MPPQAPISSSPWNRKALICAGLLMSADVLLFHLACRSGVAWNQAHIISVLAATAVACLAWLLIPGRRFAGAVVWWALPVVPLLAMFLRGGTLAILVEPGGWSPGTAILPAAAVACLVTWIGLRLWVLADPSRNAALPRSLALIAYALSLRLLYGAGLEIIHEEGYYWNYAQHLDLAYLDHPPLVGWLIALGTWMLGHTEFAIRLGALASWMVTAWFAHRLTAKTCGSDAAVRAVLLVAVLPVFTLTGLFMTPDAALVACWAGALYYLHGALMEERREAWLGVALFMGMGLLSKFTMGLLGISGLLFMLMDRRSRAWFRRPEPYLAGVLAALVFSPVIIWNARHGWASFMFQGPRRVNELFDFDLPDLIGSIVLLLTPAGVFAAVAVLRFRRSIRQGLDETRRRAFDLLLCTTVVPLLVFVLFSLSRNIKLYWTAPLWLGILPWLALTTLGRRRAAEAGLPPWSTRLWPAFIALVLLVRAGGFHYLVLGLPGVPYHPSLRLGMPQFACEVHQAAARLEQRTGERPMIVCVDTDRMASWLAFYRTSERGCRASDAVDHTTGGQLFGQPSRMYRTWHPEEGQRNRVLLLVGVEPSVLDDSVLGRHTEPLGEIREVLVTKNGKPAGRYYYRPVRTGPR